MNDDTPTSPSPVPQTYEEALRYLCRPVSKAAYPGDLGPLKSLLARLGHPESCFRSVIITGSVGKGTVAHLLAAALQEAGTRAGLFSGPHLHCYRERMAIEGELISAPELVEQVGRLAPHVQQVARRLSTFELATGLAFDWFAGQQVEAAILEVSIGGRYDAVNLAPAESAVIMPIELEHTALLGSSLAQIAHHKAGVIPENGFVIVAPQPPEALEVISATCRERNAVLVNIAQSATWHRLGCNEYRVSYDGLSLQGQTPLPGRHNALNIAVVLAWAVQAARRGQPIAPQHVARAARRLHVPGRVELVKQGGAAVFIDGAHTPTAAAALAETLKSLSPGSPLTYLIGMSRDKNASGFLRALSVPEEASLLLTAFEGHRAMPPGELARLAGRLGLKAQTRPNLGEALDQALERHAGGGLIVVTGSLYTAAQAREKLGLLDGELLAEALLNRSIFSGPGYLALVDSDPADEIAPLPAP